MLRSLRQSGPSTASPHGDKQNLCIAMTVVKSLLTAFGPAAFYVVYRSTRKTEIGSINRALIYFCRRGGKIYNRPSYSEINKNQIDYYS